MTLRAYIRASVSGRAITAGLGPMTARELANVMAWAYGGLHLSHLSRVT